MMKWLAMLLFSQIAAAAPVESEQGYEWKKGEVIRYLQFLPEGYAAKGPRLALVIFLHGSGESGTDIEDVKRNGPPKMAMQGHGFPFILVAPQSPSEHKWDAESVVALTRHLVKTLRVDPDRVHLTGISLGGYGTWAAMASAPELYASGVPICGGGDPRQAKKLVNIPIWLFHGESDSVVPVSESREMEEAIRKAGGTKIRSTYYPFTGHNCWGKAYAEPGLYAWMMMQSK